MVRAHEVENASFQMCSVQCTTLERVKCSANEEIYLRADRYRNAVDVTCSKHDTRKSKDVPIRIPEGTIF